MANGYLIAHLKIKDVDAYSIYSKAAGEAIASFAASHVAPEVIAVSSKHEHVEGETYTKCDGLISSDRSIGGQS